jgi:protein SCO1/2
VIARLFVLAAWCAALLAGGACKRQPIEIIQLGSPPPRLQKYWTIPEFTLTGLDGRPVDRSQLAGKVWVADFFFTTCPGPCEKLTNRLATVHREFAADDRVRLVSITADPETDTPDVLRKYAMRFKAGDRWLFLTGAKPAIHALARDGFKLPIASDPNAPGLITHSTRLVLIDRTDTVRGFYEGAGEDEAPVRELVADLRTLLKVCALKR